MVVREVVKELPFKKSGRSCHLAAVGSGVWPFLCRTVASMERYHFWTGDLKGPGHGQCDVSSLTVGKQMFSCS